MHPPSETADVASMSTRDASSSEKRSQDLTTTCRVSMPDWDGRNASFQPSTTIQSKSAERVEQQFVVYSNSELPHDPTEASPVSLQRELVLTSIPSLVLCVALASTDALKMIASFAMKHHNNDSYPLDASLVVLVIEMIKASVALSFHLGHRGGNPLAKFDARILVPCAVYAITNNLFFVGLLFVPPAVWMVLVQLRLAFLLLIYRVMFKHKIVLSQWVGAMVLVLSVALMQVEQADNFMDAVGPALLLAVFSSLLSAVAGIYIELVLKIGGEDELWRRQFHLYVGALFVSIGPFLVSKYYFGKRTFDMMGDHTQLIGLISLSIGLAVVHGIITSLVIKKLDNIVRFQLGALVYVFTAVLNKMIFPEQFHLSHWYIVSVVLVLYSVYIMERKSFL